MPVSSPQRTARAPTGPARWRRRRSPLRRAAAARVRPAHDRSRGADALLARDALQPPRPVPGSARFRPSPPSSATRGSWSRTSTAKPSMAPVSTYGGLETMRSKLPLTFANQSLSRKATRSTTPFSVAFSRASSRAPAEMSTAVTDARGRYRARQTAMTPLPVPRSRQRAGWSRAMRRRVRSSSCSVSVRGISASRRTLKRNPKNDTSPIRCCSGVPARRCCMNVLNLARSSTVRGLSGDR